MSTKFFGRQINEEQKVGIFSDIENAQDNDANVVCINRLIAVHSQATPSQTDTHCWK